MCPKCNGNMYVNEDNDLHCRNCGKTIVLTEYRRAYDSRTGVDLRYRHLESRGSDVGFDSREDDDEIRNKSTQNHYSKMARQRFGKGIS